MASGRAVRPRGERLIGFDQTVGGEALDKGAVYEASLFQIDRDYGRHGTTVRASGDGDYRRALGAAAEDTAAQCLARAGLAVVDRNVHLTGGEIDLVCRDGDAWVFVEVKARRRGWDDAPGAAVSWQKQRRLAALALRYLKRRGLRNVRCRFDVVEVTIDDGRPHTVRHLRSAFDAPAR